MKRQIGFVLAAAAMALLSPACGDDSESDGGGGSAGKAGASGTGGSGTGGSSGAATGGASGVGGTSGSSGTAGAAGTAGAGGTAGAAGAAGAAGVAGAAGAANKPLPEGCQTCLNQNCGAQILACKQDTECKECINTDYTNPVCKTNTQFKAACQCATSGGGPCHNECGTFCA